MIKTEAEIPAVAQRHVVADTNSSSYLRVTAAFLRQF